MENEQERALLRADEAARYVRLSVPALYRRVSEGSVLAYRLDDRGPLLFRPEELERALVPTRAGAAGSADDG